MLDKETKPPRARSTPENYPTVPPATGYPSGDYSYTLEVVMGMQKTLGANTQAITTLTEEVKGVRSKVERMSHVIYAAGVVGTILLGIGIWLLNKITDVVITRLTSPPMH